MSYYEELRHVAEVNHDDTTEIATLRDSALALQRCRENAEAFRAECAVKGATGEALDAWLRHYSQKLDEREQLLDYQFRVHNKARAHMRDARDEFATLRTELYSEMERQHFLAQETVTIHGHEVTGEAYFHGLVAQRDQEREAKAREFFEKMDSAVKQRAEELYKWKPGGVDAPAPSGVDGFSQPGVPDAGSWGSSGVGVVAGGLVAGAAGAGSAAAGVGSSAGTTGDRVSGVSPLPDSAGGAGAGGSGSAGGSGGGAGGVAPLPGDGSQRPYVRPPAPGHPGSPGYPITSPTDVADLPLTTSPVFSDGMDGGYLPPSVTNASDPRWSAGGAGVALQSGVAVGSVAAMGGGLLASRGGGLGSWGTATGGTAAGGGSGYGVVPAGGVIGRPAPGTPGATGIPGTGTGGMSGAGAAGSGTAGGPGTAGAGAAGGRAGASSAGGPMVAGGMGGAGTPGAEGSGARSGRGSLQSSLAQARAAVDRAAGTKPPSSTSVIRPSDGNTGMIGAGQGGRGRDEEERRRRRGYTAPKLDKPDDHQHDAGHWAFGAGSADTLPPVPRTRDDDQW